MLPAGIISSGGGEPAVAAFVPAPGCDTACAVVVPAAAPAAVPAGAGRLGNVVVAGLLVASANRKRVGGVRWVGEGAFTDGVWPRTSSMVKNRNRANVVVFI